MGIGTQRKTTQVKNFLLPIPDTCCFVLVSASPVKLAFPHFWHCGSAGSVSLQFPLPLMLFPRAYTAFGKPTHCKPVCEWLLLLWGSRVVLHPPGHCCRRTVGICPVSPLLSTQGLSPPGAFLKLAWEAAPPCACHLPHPSP